MCFLSNTDILQAVKDARLTITPFRPETHLQPGSYDLTLSGLFIFRGLEIQADRWALNPGQCVLAGVEEYIELDHQTGLEVMGRSSIGRKFVVPQTAGWGDPAWDGQLTLEFVNHGEETLHLFRGMRAAQVKFERSISPASPGYAGKYQHQQGVVDSRLELDPEYASL